MIQSNIPPSGGGLQAAASALRKVDLGEGASDLLDRRVKEIGGQAMAEALSMIVRTQEENLGTILDLKA